MATKTRIQLRRDSAADWTSNDPTLTLGELGYETDTGYWKFGDGSSAWTALGYPSAKFSTLYTTGDVGIRTDAPGSPLHVLGGESTGYDASSVTGQADHTGTIQVQNANGTGNSFSQLLFGLTSDSALSRIVSINGSNAGESDLAFVLTSASTPYEAMRITSAGVVEMAVGLSFTGNGSFVNNVAQVYRSASTGLTLTGYAGTTYDFAIAESGGALLLTNPVGTINLVLCEDAGNVGIGVTAFGTNASGVLGLSADEVVPSSSPAGMIQIFADDSSAGATNATLGIRTEETVTSEVLACDSTLNIWVNGTEYHLLMRAV